MIHLIHPTLLLVYENHKQKYTLFELRLSLFFFFNNFIDVRKNTQNCDLINMNISQTQITYISLYHTFRYILRQKISKDQKYFICIFVSFGTGVIQRHKKGVCHISLFTFHLFQPITCHFHKYSA